MTQREFRRLALYGEFFAVLGVEDQLTVLISEPGASVRAGISIDRDRRSFDGAERRLLDLLRPHLCAARANAIAFSDALMAPAARGGATERLTDRQRDVLAELARGLTDAQIAIELDISPHTVRKHVEHILRSLDAPTRTAAAALYLTGHPAWREARWTASLASFVAA